MISGLVALPPGLDGLILKVWRWEDRWRERERGDSERREVMGERGSESRSQKFPPLPQPPYLSKSGLIGIFTVYIISDILISKQQQSNTK